METIYRVFDKKDKYQQSYSPKLKGGKDWAVDCATILKGYVKEDILDENGVTQKSEVIFKFENVQA